MILSRICMLAVLTKTIACFKQRKSSCDAYIQLRESVWFNKKI